MAALALRSVLLFVRDKHVAASFYQQGLGLSVIAETPVSLHLRPESQPAGPSIVLQQIDDSEACLSVGYSPLINWEVADFDTTLYKLLELGAKMDGAVRYLPGGKSAALRAPDGHMFGLWEPDAAT
eukprot:m.191804 g.191804  ORF g.191804 m.191804 type:complete len:126 (-) comp18253_c0_seq1:133-510(-)